MTYSFVVLGQAMFQDIRNFRDVKITMLLPSWPGDGKGSWEQKSSGFVDYTLDPQIPDGYMPTPACKFSSCMCFQLPSFW
jgi:hypothetical protein